MTEKNLTPASPGRARPATTGATPRKPDSSVEQMQYVFHELHADGRHAVCAVCDSQYWR